MVNWVVAVRWSHWSGGGGGDDVVTRRPESWSAEFYQRPEYIRHNKNNIALPHTHLRILVPLSPISVRRRRRLATVFRFTYIASPRPVCRRRLTRAQSGFFDVSNFFYRKRLSKKRKLSERKFSNALRPPLKFIAGYILLLSITLHNYHIIIVNTTAADTK